ncbi:MAG: ATP-binding cassette domain-containing protein [Bacteroidales bacterium]|nr:ATP-binding cassette domain-containing protein [Bacteroidales bacterium]
MSEAILEALMKLFGLIAKQDAGVGDDGRNYVRTFLQSQIGEQEVELYLQKFDENAEVRLDETGHVITPENAGDVKASESVKIIGTCRKISKELEKDDILPDGTKVPKDPEVVKKQKAVIFVRIYEMIRVSISKSSDINGRMEVIDGVVLAFKLDKEEVKAIKAFSMESEAEQMDYKGILVADERSDINFEHALHIQTGKLKGAIFFLYMASVDLYFVRYSGGESYVNGNLLAQDCVSPFPTRSIIKATSATVCFFDVESKFNPDRKFDKISYEVNNMWFKFKNGNIGLRNINMAEREGQLIGIMGASGAGKTTLLNVLCGNEKPSEGEVLINGRNLHTEPEKLEGVIGLIPQDDLLIEELTVYENLYYSAKLCFRHKSEEEIKTLVDRTLDNLGLYERKDLVVGSPLNKSISGGQRKRLNIALELIREPAVLFVDEPTSGLSSGDSENVVNLLRELAVKNGKLVFVVIHQPSSDIYKMFDKMFILDTGGYPVYYGDPVGAITYTKKQIGQASADQGACSECGNVNTELVFNVLEAKVIDEWGGTSNKRKVQPQSWNNKYNENIVLPKVETVNEEPPRSLDLPSWFGQFCIYTRRDFWAKISNTQYILMNVLEAPFLGFVLAYLVRYIVDPDSDVYIFRENENIPIYIFMGIIVSIFFGLIVSAEEIFKDAKIMKRERFLNLSRSAYLMSKILILMGLSAIQMLLFILVGNAVIGFEGMNLEFFLMLFSVSVSSNILGLIISSAFNTIVTIYIMIPLLMIPQMVLGGAMFTFDKLNKTIASVDKVPFVAEFIPARYAYEGLIVYQFKHNKFHSVLFETAMQESWADFRQTYIMPELTTTLDRVLAKYKAGKTDDPVYIGDLALLHNELGKEKNRHPQIDFNGLDNLTPDKFNGNVYNQTQEYIEQLTMIYAEMFRQANTKRDKTTEYLLSTQPEKYNALKDAYFNETVSDVVRKTFDKNKMLRDGDRLIQILDPIYQMPEPEPGDWIKCRMQFFAPAKYFLGVYWDTLWFNMACIWLITIFLYIALYYDWAHRGFEFLGEHVATPLAAKMDEISKKRAARKKAKREAAAQAAAEKAEAEKKAIEEAEKKAKEEAKKKAEAEKKAKEEAEKAAAEAQAQNAEASSGTENVDKKENN